MGRIRLPGPELRVDGEPVVWSSQLVYAGAHQLTISTAVPALGG